VVGDTTLKRVTLASGKGALGTWRSEAGQRRESEEPSLQDEPEGQRDMSGVYASQRLSFLMFRKTFRGKPGSEPYSGNPTVRDRRGACGNVDASRARRSSIPTRSIAEPMACKEASGLSASASTCTPPSTVYQLREIERRPFIHKNVSGTFSRCIPAKKVTQSRVASIFFLE